MNVYEVGKPYRPGRTSWPEATQYHYMAGEHHLQVFMRQPRNVEVQAYRDGPADFALVVDGPVIALLWRFGGTPWSDAPYSWHMVPADQRVAPPAGDLPEGKGALLTTMLIGADDGVIRVIRTIGLGTAFSNRLHAAIRAQAADAAWDQAGYDERLDQLYASYPSTELMLSAAVARWPEPSTQRTPRGRART